MKILKQLEDLGKSHDTTNDDDYYLFTYPCLSLPTNMEILTSVSRYFFFM
jgi:hypothetical protein